MDRDRMLKAALAMGIDPSMAETVIQDPRFADSVEQYERMQQAQGAPQAQPAQQADPQQLMAAAMAQGYTQEQAQAYAQQYIQQQQQQAQQAAASSAPPQQDPQQLLAAAIAQGYTPEQAQLYVQQYMQQQAALAAAAGPAAADAPPAAPQAAQASTPESSQQQPQQSGGTKSDDRVAMHASTPQILNLEEGRRGQYRATLKAVIMGDFNGRRTFRDILIKGPWRSSKRPAEKDQAEISKAFKFDGEKGADAKARELDDKDWTRAELEEREVVVKEDQLQLEEDDFDAEAEDEKEEPEPELVFDGHELPAKVQGLHEPGGPIFTWDEGVARGCVAPAVRQALAFRMMDRPTLIQRFALPLLAKTHLDVLAQAQTGSGKTLAFVIPIVSRLLMNPPVQRPYFAGSHAQASPVALLMSPTRELAIQTSKNVSELLQQAGSSMTVLTMYGGETLGIQCKPIDSRNIDIMCGTPGRLLAVIDCGKLSLSFCNVVVLDEADQMLDLAVGLEGQVLQITDGRDLPRKQGRQTLLFSATMPDYQTRQFHSVLKAPPYRVKLRVGHYTEDEKGGSCRHITQILFPVRDMDERWERMGRDIMQVWGPTTQRREGKGIVFTNRIALAVPIEQALRRFGISSGQLHGKQSQDVREDVVKRFRQGEYEMLIASNVASRGLDFPDIRLVVQFELPKTVEIYTHRIGRTGRAGQTGTAVAYFAEGPDRALGKPLVEFLRLNEQRVPSWLEDIAEPGGRRRSRSRERYREERDYRSSRGGRY